MDFNTLSRVRILAKLEPIVDPSILGKESKRYLLEDDFEWEEVFFLSPLT